jgi:phenylpropionate dioxygenase-like ring-hydroxylating dioxygenase large terminal subunit
VFLQDVWYPVAQSKEVRGVPLARQIAGERLVMFRVGDGSAVVLEDRCAHRAAPLSLGRVRGDVIQCGYHGIEYDRSGAAVDVPCQTRFSPATRVRSYPAVERHNFVWAWIGDARQADPGTVPDLWWNDHPDWRGDGDTLFIKCDYRLLIDNLLDLTHETYVHEKSAGHPIIVKTPCETTWTDDTVSVTRVMGPFDVPPPWKGWVEQGIGWYGEVYRYNTCTFMLPCIVAIETGAARADRPLPNDNPAESITSMLINACVPADETSCWQMWVWPRKYATDDHRLTGEVVAGINQVFAEDVVMLEAQQRNIAERPDGRMIGIATDQGPLRAREIIDRRIRAQAAARSATAAATAAS